MRYNSFNTLTVSETPCMTLLKSFQRSYITIGHGLTFLRRSLQKGKAVKGDYCQPRVRQDRVHASRYGGPGREGTRP
jgi:hypothetical protein